MLQLIVGHDLMIRLHLVAATYWAGAIIFLAIVASPVIDRIRPPSFQRHLARRLWQSAHLTMWIAAGIVLVTGALLVRTSNVSRDYFSLGFWTKPFGIKLLLVAAMVILSLVHDMLLGYGARLVDPRESTEPPGLYGQLIPWVVAGCAVVIIVLSVSLGP